MIVLMYLCTYVLYILISFDMIKYSAILPHNKVMEKMYFYYFFHTKIYIFCSILNKNICIYFLFFIFLFFLKSQDRDIKQHIVPYLVEAHTNNRTEHRRTELNRFTSELMNLYINAYMYIHIYINK